MRFTALPQLAQAARAYTQCANPSLYQALGLSQNATPAEIRDSYVRLAKQHHPDRGGDPQRFVQVHTAYAALRQARARTSRAHPGQQQGASQGRAGEGHPAWSLGCGLLVGSSGMGAAAYWARARR